MKLIDILVEELPKRDGWPAKASHAVYAKRFSRVCFTVGGAPAMTGDDVSIFEDDGADHGAFWLSGALLDCEEPVDYATAIITREQYEAALAAKNDGWIEWGGGKNPPVSTNTVVDVKLEKGYVQSGYPAGEYSWEHIWQGSNIIAYRLHQPTKSEQVRAAAWNAYAGITRADDEADLNECIGQDAAPVWSGEGHPPVGVECEYSWAGEPWASGVIRYISKHTIIIETQGDSTGDTECAYHPTDIKLRPLRTEADRKRDDICDKIYGAMTNAKRKDNHSDMAEEIYDAIAAGKIPGVKLED